MGAEGAGLATFLSRLVTPFLIIGYCAVHEKSRRYLILLRNTRVEWSRIRSLLSVGFPICVQMSLEGWTFAFSGIMMGWISDTAIAANQIATTLCNIAFLSLVAISSATTIRVSHAYGVGDYEAIRRIGSSSYRIGMVWNAFTAFAFILLRDILPQAFTADEDVIVMTSKMLVVVAMFQFSDGMQCIGMGILRGMQDVRITMRIAFVAYLIINLPLGYIFGFVCDWGEIGVWIGYIFGLSAAALMLRRRFKHNLLVAEQAA
jgi:MATE family multidrug resistance protein